MQHKGNYVIPAVGQNWFLGVLGDEGGNSVAIQVFQVPKGRVSGQTVKQVNGIRLVTVSVD